VIRTYQYRLYPTSDQQNTLTEILDLARWLYNHALAYRRKRWNESRYRVTYDEQAAMWREWRNEQPDDNPLRLLNMTAGQQVLRRLDQSYTEFLKGKRGRPRFKGKRYFHTLTFKPGDGAAIKDGKLYIQNVGNITVKWHRDLPAGKLKNILITRKASGWYVSVQVEVPEVVPLASDQPAVGGDVGLYHALALSDGTVIARATKKRLTNWQNCKSISPISDGIGGTKSSFGWFTATGSSRWKRWICSSCCGMNTCRGRRTMWGWVGFTTS